MLEEDGTKINKQPDGRETKQFLRKYGIRKNITEILNG